MVIKANQICNSSGIGLTTTTSSIIRSGRIYFNSYVELNWRKRCCSTLPPVIWFGKRRGGSINRIDSIHLQLGLIVKGVGGETILPFSYSSQQKKEAAFEPLYDNWLTIKRTVADSETKICSINTPSVNYKTTPSTQYRGAKYISKNLLSNLRYFLQSSSSSVE